MQRRLVNLHTIFFEHMKQRCLASIVETQEQDLCALMVEACGRRQHVVEPVHEKHDDKQGRTPVKSLLRLYSKQQPPAHTHTDALNQNAKPLGPGVYCPFACRVAA
eukprot:18483-Heterococcus_DN1.PRE.1